MLFNENQKSFLYSISILIGTVVGVGVFGIPFSFAKSGFLIGFLFLIFVGALSLIINLIFGEIVLRTKGIHQFTGYVKIYLGQTMKIVASFAWFLSIYGALLAYIIISGSFLFNIFISQFYATTFFYSILFFFFVSLAILAGLRILAKFELFMVIFFAVLVVLILILGIPKIEVDNLTSLFNKEFWFLPYGVLLFAYAGFSAIPTQKEIIKNNNSILKKSILFGSLIPLILYFLFAVSIVGISGETTSPDVVSGLTDFFDYRLILAISLFGFLAVTTSFLALGFALTETLRFDYGLKRFYSWILTVFVPFILFLFGARNFIEVISLVGSVAIGIEGIILIAIYIKAKKTGQREPEYSLNLSPWVLYGAAILFAIGGFYALFL